MRTIFVEGTTDRVILKAVLDGSLPNFTSIYPIESFDVDLGQMGFDGARGRIVAACSSADELGIKTVVGVVDRNFYDTSTVGQSLVETFYPDIEWEIEDVSVLTNVVAQVFARDVSGRTVPLAASLSTAIYQVRSLGRSRGIGIGLPDSATYLPVKAGSVVIDRAKLLHAMDQINGTGHIWRDLDGEVEESISEALERTDWPMAIGFHSFEEILCYCLQKLDNFPGHLFHQDWLGQLIRARIDPAVATSPFFLRILRKMHTGNTVA